MGSGPVTHLASLYPRIAALILVSPYTSFKAVTKSYAGTVASLLVRERFDNLQKIKSVKCPTLIIHGQRDEIIPVQHSKDLHAACNCPCKLILPSKMSHNNHNRKEGGSVEKAVVEPMKAFFVESNI